MSAWRVIITDSESLSGVAPACPNQDDDPHAVYDCCPKPHIECYSEWRAKAIAAALTAADAEICP